MWGEEEWTPWRMTVAWSTIQKEKMIPADRRSGKKSTYLPYAWVGYMLFKSA